MLLQAYGWNVSASMTTGTARVLVRARRRRYPKPENISTFFLPSLPKYNDSRGGATGFCAVCIHTDTASAVGGWGTNYTKIRPEFNTRPVLPCKYLFSASISDCFEKFDKFNLTN